MQGAKCGGYVYNNKAIVDLRELQVLCHLQFSIPQFPFPLSLPVQNQTPSFHLSSFSVRPFTV